MIRKVIWHILVGFAYLAVVYGVMSAAKSKFETLVLASLVLIYTATLYNFTFLGAVTDANNHAGFVRFRILATAQGLTGNKDGLFADQENNLLAGVKNSETRILIKLASHGVVSAYALYKIIAVVLFG
jgi:hypothetical protein